MKDLVLNNINNNTDKHLKLIATKKVLKMDNWAIKNISMRFIHQKQVNDYHN